MWSVEEGGRLRYSAAGRTLRNYRASRYCNFLLSFPFLSFSFLFFSFLLLSFPFFFFIYVTRLSERSKFDDRNVVARASHLFRHILTLKPLTHRTFGIRREYERCAILKSRPSQRRHVTAEAGFTVCRRAPRYSTK
jgi:hypothetical protein